MNAQIRSNPDDTRTRILEVAQMLFRRLGFAKLTVADIASELGMSPANIYRFFPSKAAIIEALCQSCLGELESKVWTIARGRGSAAQRLEQLVLAIHQYHLDNILKEQRVADILLFALESRLDAVHAHQRVVLNGFEMILRDGVEAHEFAIDNPRETARHVFLSCAAFMHPVMIAQSFVGVQDLQADARATVRLVTRAIAAPQSAPSST